MLSATTVAVILTMSGEPTAPSKTVVTPAQNVRATETAFAKTMADRDHAGFVSYLADETVFIDSSATLRGRDRVAEEWKQYFDGAEAPFAWAPAEVEVLASGKLGFSSGPIYNRKGERVGTYNSVWRLEPDGKWRIVFDKGCP